MIVELTDNQKTKKIVNSICRLSYRAFAAIMILHGPTLFGLAVDPLRLFTAMLGVRLILENQILQQTPLSV